MDAKAEQVETIERAPQPQHHHHHHHDLTEDARIVPMEQEAHENVTHVNLSWRSWLVVFVTCWAYVYSPLFEDCNLLTKNASIMAQVFVVTAAGSVIAFIIRDLGDTAISGWVIQVWFPSPHQSSASICRQLLTPPPGPLAHAKRSLSNRRPTFRCLGPEIHRFCSSYDCIHRRSCIGQGNFNEYADWRRDFDWNNLVHDFDCAVYSE